MEKKTLPIQGSTENAKKQLRREYLVALQYGNWDVAQEVNRKLEEIEKAELATLSPEEVEAFGKIVTTSNLNSTIGWIPVQVALPTIVCLPEAPHILSNPVLIHITAPMGLDRDVVATRVEYPNFEEGWGWYSAGTWYRPERVTEWCEIPPRNKYANKVNLNE